MVAMSTDRFPAELLRLLSTARVELDTHINDRGRCLACQVSFPCERACLADLALAGF